MRHVLAEARPEAKPDARANPALPEARPDPMFIKLVKNVSINTFIHNFGSEN